MKVWSCANSDMVTVLCQLPEPCFLILSGRPKRALMMILLPTGFHNFSRPLSPTNSLYQPALLQRCVEPLPLRLTRDIFTWPALSLNPSFICLAAVTILHSGLHCMINKFGQLPSHLGLLWIYSRRGSVSDSCFWVSSEVERCLYPL